MAAFAGVEGDEGKLAGVLALVDDDLVGGVADGEIAPAQGRDGVAEGDELADEGAQVMVPGGRVVPGERAPAVGVVAAGEADFVAVVEGGRAGDGHLAQEHEADQAGIAVYQGEQARGVVAAEHGHLGLDDFGVVEPVVQVIEGGGKFLAADRPQFAYFIL